MIERSIIYGISWRTTVIQRVFSSIIIIGNKYITNSNSARLLFSIIIIIVF